MIAPDFMERLAGARDNPSEFSELVFGTRLHAGQKKYAENATADVNFLLPGNSWGKTEFILRFAFFLSWYKDGVDYETAEEWLQAAHKGLISSYAHDIATESFDRFEVYYKNRPEVNMLVQRVDRSDPKQVELVNGAVIDWGTLDQGGKSVEAARRNYIFVDEAGHIPDLAYTFDSILFPRTMGVGGRIHLIGTPKPHSDPYLLEVSEKGRDGTDPFYRSQSGSVLENEFWPQAERERVLRNPRYVTGWVPCPDDGCDALDCWVLEGKHQHPKYTPMGRQVVRGDFIIAGGYFFNRLHVRRMFAPVEDDQFPGEPKWEGDDHMQWDYEGETAPAGRLYMGAFDLAGNRIKRGAKKGSDATVGFVVDYTEQPFRIVRYEYIRGGDADWEEKYDLFQEVYETYKLPYLLIDATGTVDSIQEALQKRGIEVEGIHFGGASNKKFDMLRNLQFCLETEWGGSRGLLRSPPIPRLQHELERYVLPDDDIEQDTVMALAMVAHHVAQEIVPPATTGEMF